jgi:hypothetical protein
MVIVHLTSEVLLDRHNQLLRSWSDGQQPIETSQLKPRRTWGPSAMWVVEKVRAIVVGLAASGSFDCASQKRDASLRMTDFIVGTSKKQFLRLRLRMTIV